MPLLENLSENEAPAGNCRGFVLPSSLNAKRMPGIIDASSPGHAGGRLRLLFTNLRPMWATDNISKGAKVLALL